MAKYASVKRRPKDEAKPSPGTLAHNQRLAKNIDLLPKEHRLPNHHLVKLSNVTKVFNEWSSENEERYQEINGRKLRSDAHRLESLAIILSEEQVGKCNPDDIWEKALEFRVWFETRYKTTVRTMDWHRDEGYLDDEGKVIINEHIHLEFDNVNDDGKMTRKLFSKGDLIGFQDKIAEIYKPFGFIRGEDTSKKVRSDQPKVGMGQKEYKKKKVIESKATRAERAKQADLRQANKELREQLKENKATRADYAVLEAEVKELKEKIKAKDLSTAEFEAKIKELEEQEQRRARAKSVEKERIEELEAQILLEKQATVNAKREVREVEVEKIVYQEDTVSLKAAETRLAIQEHTIREKDAQNRSIKHLVKRILQRVAIKVQDFMQELDIQQKPTIVSAMQDLGQEQERIVSNMDMEVFDKRGY